MSSVLADLASRVDELLLRPGNMAAARALAEACLADPVQGNVDAFQFPTNPDNALDWTEESIAIERDHEQARALTPGQTTLVLAILHDVYCPGVEQIVAAPAVAQLLDDEGRTTSDYGRYVRWRAIRSRVRGLGDHAVHWFTLLFRRWERVLSESASQPESARTGPSAKVNQLLGGPTPRADGPEAPHWLWLNNIRHRIGKGRSRLSWQLLQYFWLRDSATYEDLQGSDKPWPDPVNDSAVSTAVNRFNTDMPRGFRWKLVTKNRCVAKESRENPAV
jgi:hypothetical protein